ncbi:TolC family protein [Geobacter sp. DSM 9736]|uniref:TolC family protein n=1 Tax=Geobacter sp. DSM 9736 TaxID=1277350 RepID=UPI000B500344|nr:TolC family protein [Geobacter sp. DSM 9736]SNB45520.1 outer membrane protein, cobalt-zinc-cadmium efflux system [Geobacter sp. DSM 9736]
MATTAFARGALLLVPGIVCILTSAPVRAEEQTLPLPQVIEYSLQNNGDLKAFRDEKGIRDAGKVRAGLLPNPTLDFEAATGALTGSSSESALSLGISQEFLLAGKRDKRLAIAERELEIYRWQLADRERVIREEVKSAFYDVLLAEQRIALTDRSIALSRQLLDITRERLAAGDIPELEMNLAKVELARSEGARIENAKALNQNQSKLLNLMSLPTEKQFAISGNLDSATNLTKTLADLKQLAHGERPDVKALEAEKRRGEADSILAEAEGVPNLTAGLAVNREATSIEVGGIEAKDKDYIIGLRLSMPIPVFDRNQAGVQEARAKRSSAESRLLATRRNVNREVETAYASYLNSEKILSMYKADIIPQLEENLKLTQDAYSLGEVGILAVIQEQKKFFEVSDGYLTALHARQLALVKLESAVATELTGGAQ